MVYLCDQRFKFLATNFKIVFYENSIILIKIEVLFKGIYYIINPIDTMQSNTPTIRSVKPSFGGTGSAFEPVVINQDESNTHLIKSRNDRKSAFVNVRSLFRANKQICCVVN